MSNVKSIGSQSAQKQVYLWILLAVIVIAISAGLRLIKLDADPAPWLDDGGYQIDEGYKTLAPRNLINFGATRWNDKDQYPGWMSSSPLTQWPYYFAFKNLGLEISSARLVNLCYSVALIALLGWFLYSRLPAAFATLGIIVLTADMGLFLFSRSALFETSITLMTFIALVIAAKIPPQRDYVAATVLLLTGVAATFLVKLTAILYVAPAVLAIVLMAASRHITLRRQHAIYALILFIGVIVMAWLTRDTWQERLGLAKFVAAPQALFYNPLYTLSPLALVMAYAVILDFSLRNPAALFFNRYRVMLASIVIIVPIAYTLFRYFPQRYFLPVIPAALLLVIDWLAAPALAEDTSRSAHRGIALTVAIIATLGLVMNLHALGEYFVLRYLPIQIGADPGLDTSMLLKLYPVSLLLFILLAHFVLRRHWSRISRPVVYGLVCAHVIVGLIAVVMVTANPRYEARALGERMRALVGADKSVGGDWAPFFFKELPQRVLYMRPDWNNSQHITAIRPDYFLFSSTYYDHEVRAGLEQNPTVSLGSPVDLGSYHGSALLLYPITYKDETTIASGQ